MKVLDENRNTLGTCVKYPKGWRFIPAIASHKPGRKYHSDAVGAIPNWALDMADKVEPNS